MSSRWSGLRCGRLPLLGFALLVVSGILTTAEAQFSNGYSYRREVDFVDAKVIGGVHSNFPVLIDSTLLDLRTAANGGKVENINGYDVIFTSDQAGTTQLAHEIESYSPVTGRIVFWVRVESLAATTSIYMFYGNSSIATFQGDVTSNGVTGVWDDDYEGVWHLHDDLLDATSNGNDGTNSGSTDITGKVADGQSFDGTNDYVDAGSNASLDVSGTQITVEAWIKADSWESSWWQAEIAGNHEWVPRDGYVVRVGSGNVGFQFGDGASWHEAKSSDSSMLTGQWYHLVGRYDGSSLEVFINGTSKDTTATSAGISSSTSNVNFGRNSFSGDRFFDGMIDEVRISSVARSAPWIETEYNSQSSSSTSYTLGAETTPPSADLALTKTVDDSTPTEGDTVVYTVVLDNNGPSATTNVTVTDLLPGGVTYVSDVPTTGSYISGTGVWTVGSMANGASETLTITTTVDPGTATTTIVNTASVSASDLSDPTPGNDSDGANITVQTANLTLTKTDSPDPAPSNGPLLYNLLVTNNGPHSATVVEVTDTLPASTTLQSATPSQGSCSGTTTVTCNLGAILSGGTASIEILVTTSGTGTINNSASVTAHEIDLVPGDNSASEDTDVVADSTTDIPLTQYTRLHGFLDHVVTGGSLRTQPNNGDPCAVGASSAEMLSGIPATATVQAAYLYWSGSGVTPDDQVTLDGVPLTADRVFEADFVLGATTYEFFGAFKDVTAQVAAKRNGVYTFANLTVSTGNPWCSFSTVLGGWSLFVVYEETSLTGKTLVLYDGFDIARNGSTSYLLSGIYASGPPEAKTTTLLWEGDPTMSGASEQLLFNGAAQSDALNPVNNVYNSTINSLGSSTAHGMDLDTFDVSSLVNVGDALATTQVDSGPDMVILNTVLLQAKTNVIVGTVFEDVNYGGGAGRDYSTAKAAAPAFTVGRPNVVVELYDTADNFLRNTLTDASGNYGFTGLPGGAYTVRVVNETVSSSRPGATGTEWPVQTFRTDASGAGTTPVTDEVGGSDPTAPDDPPNLTSANLSSITAQSLAPVTIGAAQTKQDVDFGYNFDTVVNTNDTGLGSLRQILANANALSNAGLALAGRPAGVESAISMLADGTARPGLNTGYPSQFVSGVATISPATAFPIIDDPIFLDAALQPGFAGSPIVELAGNAAGAGVDGLTINAGSSVVRGFIINRFEGDGILLTTNGGNLIAGNYIGTDSSGLAAQGNGLDGIRISESSGNTIGGTTTADRNVISGNGVGGDVSIADGIWITGVGATGNLIQGNLIGTDRLGTGAVPNLGDGISFQEGANGNTVGGVPGTARNVVSGNAGAGIYLEDPGTTGNVIQGNHVGTDLAGVNALPNGTDGIRLWNLPSGNTIGGAGAGNIIAFNTMNGINLWTAEADVTIQENSVHSNSALGIDLGNDGVTANDGAKNAAESNMGQDAPVFTSATLGGTTLTVAGYVGSAPAQPPFANSRVEVFVSDEDGTGFGEGRTYLGSLTTDPSDGDFSGSFTVAGLSVGDKITGTATDGSGNTSEFGANATVAYRAIDLHVDKSVDSSTPVEGSTISYTVTVTNNGPDPATTVSLDDVLPAGVTGTGTVTPSAGTSWSSPTWTIGTLGIGGVATLVIDATVDAGTSGNTITNTVANVTFDQPDSDATADSLSAGLTVGNDTDLRVLKSVDDPAPDEGQVITYTVTVTNNGPAQATGVGLDDVLPAGLTVGAVTPSAGTSWTAPTWTVGTLSNGASATLDIQATVDAGTSGSTITNTVTNVTLDQTDSDATNDTLSAP
ncbi:MAG: DUF2341 domain-containing protein, partial [Actinomycetia bacterium]|nr:DUF2341 domain-containing protein [Actinomycetes bacterium]